MKLYHWVSKALADWADGDIIVLAETATQAREIARREFLNYLRDDRFLNLDDPDDRERIDEAKNLLEQDLAADPFTLRCLLITGSA